MLPLSTSTSLINMAYIVINFAGDQDVVSSIHMIPEGDEISISLEKNSERNGNRLIKEILRNYLDAHHLSRYKIMELENILTVGIPKKIEEISNLLMCEICGWRLNTEEELLVHRRTHWI